MPVIPAIVAACNRADLLANRSLPSVLRESRPPDLLPVVGDSEDVLTRRANSDTVSDHMVGSSRVVYLENQRTKGAAGAWNTRSQGGRQGTGATRAI